MGHQIFINWELKTIANKYKIKLNHNYSKAYTNKSVSSHYIPRSLIVSINI